MEVEAALDPASHGIRARFRVTGYPQGPWWLHDGLKVVGCCVDGQPGSVRRLLDGPSAPFSPRVHQVEVVPWGTRLDLDVVGTIPGVEAEVNCLGADLVELAVYSAWHPVFVGFPRFDFTLELEVDGPGQVEVGGLPQGDGSGGTSRWRSARSVFDIAVVCSPAFVEVRHDHLPVRALATRASSPAASELVELVGSAMSACSSWWGPTVGAADSVTIVVSPRAGWMYARSPLILLPDVPEVSAELRHIVLHETAHMWWSIANPISADDWLNEGLAEYTAHRLGRHLLPAGFIEARMAAILAEVAAHPDDGPVLESSQDSPASHRNLYLRPAIALDVLEQRVGTTALDRVLTEWLAAPTPLTTSVALAVLEQQLGHPAADYLHHALAEPGWHPDGPTALPL